MKNLYNIVEGILDIDDKKLDDISDRSFWQIIIKKLANGRPVDIKYDQKKNIIKSKETLCVSCINNIIAITCSYGRSEPTEKITLEEWKKYGISFDGNLSVSLEAINAGVKLSDLNIISKNHFISVHSFSLSTKAWYQPVPGMFTEPLKKFLDIHIDPTTVLYVDFDEKLFMDPVCNQFDAVKTSFPKFYSGDFNITNCQAKVLLLEDAQEWKIFKGKKLKIYKDWLECEYYGDNKHSCARNNLKRIVKDNPKTKILISSSFSGTFEYIQLDGENLNINIIKGAKPWTKV